MARETLEDRIAAIRLMAQSMTPEAIAAAMARVQRADEYQAAEYAARGTRTSQQACISVWTHPEHFAAQIAMGHDPFSAE